MCIRDRRKEKLILLKAKAEDNIIQHCTLDDTKKLCQQAAELLAEPTDAIRRRIESLSYERLSEFEALIETFDATGSGKRASDFHSFAISFFYPQHKVFSKMNEEMSAALVSLSSAFEFQFSASFMSDGGSITMDNVKAAVEARKKTIFSMSEEERVQQKATAMAQQMAQQMVAQEVARYQQLNTGDAMVP